MELYTGAENTLSEIHYMLKKDTDKVMTRHEYFFNSLNSEIKCIYSHGFSFGEVDLSYITKICESLPTENITWFLNDYDKSQHAVFEERLRCAGFRGRISTFSI